MKKEITVLDEKSVEKLPKATQKLIKELGVDLKATELNTFNPIVEAMVVLEGFNTIVYVEDNDECIVQYKAAKKQVGSFNSSTKLAKKTLKADILEKGRKLDTIEKTFLARAKEIMTKVDLEFKPYLDEKQLKADAALAKKNKKQIDKIADLEQSTVSQNLVIERSKIFNRITASNQAMLDDVIEKLDNYSEMALVQQKGTLEANTFVIPQEDLNVLLADQVENLTVSYDTMKATCIKMVQGRLNEIELDAIAKAKEEEVVVEEVKVAPAPFTVPSAQGYQSFGKSVTEILEKASDEIKRLPTTSDKEIKAQASVVGGLGGYALKILNFLDEE